jgi:hypothetical protein
MLALALLAACLARADDAAPYKPEDYRLLPFDILAAFPYDLPGGESVWGSPATGFKTVRQVIPESILALNGSKAAVTGYMIPLDLDGVMVHSFALVRSRMSCCYGRAPKLNEWVLVDLPKGKHTYYFKDIPMTVYGALAVGEVKEGAQVTGIYKMVMDMMRAEQEGRP